MTGFLTFLHALMAGRSMRCRHEPRVAPIWVFTFVRAIGAFQSIKENIMTLTNKVVLITGAAGGIGRAMAQRFAKEGARVAVCDLKGEAAKAAARELAGTALGVEMDVTDEASVNSGVATVVKNWGTVDVLIANAGIQIVHRTEDFPFAEWKRLLAIHLDGAFLTTKACLPHMYKQKSGTVILMGSVHSKLASPLKSAYVTAKHGLIGLARTLAKEGAEFGVRANVICPGFVKTPLVEKQIPEQAARLGISEEEVVKKVMLGGTVDGEFTTLEDVAEVAVMFARFPTNALTGQSLIVSHGWAME
jgi:3-hydroxybutyrate dehydrogenase